MLISIWFYVVCFFKVPQQCGWFNINTCWFGGCGPMTSVRINSLWNWWGYQIDDCPVYEVYVVGYYAHCALIFGIMVDAPIDWVPWLVQFCVLIFTLLGCQFSFTSSLCACETQNFNVVNSSNSSFSSLNFMECDWWGCIDESMNNFAIISKGASNFILLQITPRIPYSEMSTFHVNRKDN